MTVMRAHGPQTVVMPIVRLVTVEDAMIEDANAPVAVTPQGMGESDVEQIGREPDDYEHWGSAIISSS